MSAVEMQAEMRLVRAASRTVVPVEMIRSRRTAGQAFTLACDACGLDDKEIAFALDMDKGTFSRIKAGTNTLDADRIAAFCEVVGNTVYPEWIAFQTGHGLVLLKSEAERLLDQRTQQLDLERERVRMLTDILQGRAKV